MSSLNRKHLPITSAGGLYIHIPFCVRKCPYCDFYSIADDTLVPVFIPSLIKEMEKASPIQIPMDTLYFGGGTPSIIRPSDIDRLIQTAYRVFSLSSEAEITIEANPGTIGLRQLEDLRHAGINRINIGVQSFQKKQLQFLGRIHSENEARKAIKQARQAGYNHLGLDLIYGMPGQSRSDWLNDLKEAVEFSPEHLSCYMLTYEPDTPLDMARKKGRLFLPDDGQLADLFETTCQFLKAHAYHQYEISNFERSDPGGLRINRSRHNQKYWNYSPYLGFGPSAHSFIEPIRYWNIRDVETYIVRLDSGHSVMAGQETLTLHQQMIEWIYLGLRQTDGISIERFNRKFNRDFHTLFEPIIIDLEEKGLIKTNQTVCALTLSGMLLCDSITDRFVSYDMNG